MIGVEHYKKKVKRDKLSELLSLLKQHGRLRSSVLKEKLGVSSPTLSAYLRELKRENKIEDLTVKDEDGRFKWYRIKSESKENVEAEIGKFEAIRFIGSISNPVYTFVEQDGKAIAAFMSDPGTASLRNIAKRSMDTIVSAYLKFPNLLKFSPAENQKIAVVIMLGKKGVEP